MLSFYCVFLSEVYYNKSPEKVSHDRKPTYNERVNSGKYPTFIQMIKLLVSRELVLNQLYLNGILQHVRNRSIPFPLHDNVRLYVVQKENSQDIKESRNSYYSRS